MIVQGKVELRYLTPRLEHDIVRVSQALRYVIRWDVWHA